MRQGHQNNKRMRGRGGRKGANPLQRSYESNGPDVKIRGNALHVAEKYVQLARDAASSGDRVAEQNYLQHAEHYYRIVAAAQAQMPQQQIQRSDADDADDEESFGNRGNGESAESYGDRGDMRPPRAEQPKAPHGLSEPQPYENGGGMEGRTEGAALEGADTDGTEAAAPPAPRRPRRAPRQRAPRGEIRVAAEEAAVTVEE